jgi:hypothetical protein
MEKDATALTDVFRIWDCAFDRCVQSGVMKCFRQYGCTEHVRDAFKVVRHRREADFTLIPDNPCIRKRECIDVASSDSGVTRACILLQASSYKK